MCFHVFITKVPNGSHPYQPFSQQYYLDERLCELSLNPSYNNGYIHHANTKDLKMVIDLTSNTYIIEILMTYQHNIHKVVSNNRFTELGYLTDIEIRYDEPGTPQPQISRQPSDPLVPQTDLTSQVLQSARIDHKKILDEYFKYLKEPYYLDEIKQKIKNKQPIDEKRLQKKILETELRFMEIREIKKMILRLKKDLRR